ncbi:ribonuclease H-like domain-containing protein [Carboxylicivirga sediminis]|uniref:Ribonuclease H-like domain-containing protein n=1 Tax=Carboxylicivirga sediminis TaxID=2006564 RepID=A0A941F3H2_9BACT|nr:3'-5' exonuclease [Carboxylicivirga sediminis]MBR8535358.1 ribonuclease H-like domain-containing protein [Carboxylicivirga sediminis]
MKLHLKNPIVFFDLETTGINIANDRIVEIAILKVNVDGSEESYCYKVNPEIPIPQVTSEIHGIYDEDVKDAPTFKELGKTLAKIMEGCDIAGFNSNKFDVPLLAEEFIRADVDFDMKKRKFVDVQTIFHKMEKRTLSAAYKFYCDKDLNNAHSAEADTKATYEVLKAQLDRYEELENNIEFLNDFSSFNRNADFIGRIIFNDKGVEVFNFGKYKGKSVEEVLKKDPSYYGWMMNGDFPLFTKKVLTNIKLRSFNK